MSEPAAPQPNSRSRKWRDSAAQDVGAGAQRSKRGQLFGLLFLAMIVVGAVAGVITLLSPAKPPIFITLPVTQYDDYRLPPNPFAEQDGEALKTAFARGGKPAGVARASQEREYLLSELANLKTRAPDEALVLHVSALAVSDGTEAFFFSEGSFAR